MKKCSKCKIEKLLEEFNRYIKSPDGHQNTCRQCVSDYNRQRYQKKREDIIEYQRNYRSNPETREKYLESKKKEYQKNKTPYTQWKKHLKNRYDITPEQYEQILVEQGGVCGNIFCLSDKDPQLDHDHDTNFVRGILCRSCNLALGFLTDNIEKIMGLAQYLADPPQLQNKIEVDFRKWSPENGAVGF